MNIPTQNPRWVQIIPADGWYARYITETGDAYARLVCWVMVEDAEGWRSLSGVESSNTYEDGLFLSSENQQFAGYCHRDQLPKHVEPWT